MAKKMKRIPFDLEMAKAITKGEKEGRIVVDGYEDTKIVSFNNNGINPIIALLSRNGYDTARECNAEGVFYIRKASGKFYYELCLEVPDEQEFKEGDVVVFRDDSGDHLSILKSITDTAVNLCALTTSKQELFSSAIDVYCNMGAIRLATPEERQQLIDVLKKDNSDKAMEYLKRFFGIEVEHKFTLNQEVLVRDIMSEWRHAHYSHFSKIYNQHVADAMPWQKCIPYNEQTKHLLGTTDDWEG